MKQSTLKLYFFDACVPYRSETTRWVFHVSAFPIKPRQKRRLGESFATLSEDSASSATAEGRAKMQRQAISLGVVAPVVLARRRVAATPAATSSRAPPADQKSHFLGRRPSHGASAPPRGPPSLRAVADAAPARAPRGRGRGGKGGRGGGGGGSGGSSADASTSARIQGELTGARDPRDILAIVDADGDSFDPIHTATAIHRIATHTKGDATRESVTSSPSFAALMDLVRANLGGMNAQGLANVAWACARLDHSPGAALLDDITAGLERELTAKPKGRAAKAREVKPQAVSNTVWALGSLRHRPSDDALASIFRAVGPRLRDFRAQELTNVVLGAAHMEYVPGEAFNASVFDAVRQNVQSFEGQETSNLLWALARVGARAPDELVSTLLEQSAAQNLGGMASALNLSQCLWACAKMGVAPPETYVKAVDAELPRCAARLTTESVDCILWALATMGAPLGADAMDALTNSAARLADRMDAEMLVKTHWSLARLRHRPAPGDMQQIVSAARRLADELPVDDRLTVMHAWGVLRTNPGDDVIRAYTADFRGEDEGEDAPGARESELDGDQAAKLLCAYGRTRHQPPGAHAAALANKLVEEAAEGSLHPGAAVLGLWGASLLDMRMSTKQLDILARNAIVQDKKLAPRSLAKIVWALAALGYDPTPKDLAALKDRSAHAMPRLMAKDQEALREALARLGDVQITRA